jgi:hypothetical protein
MMRRYQVNWSRFAQPDPYDGAYNMTDPQSFNRYAYVQNDPVNFVDPSGLLPCVPGNTSAECGWSGFGGWGGGFNFNDRGHPGREIIAEAEPRTATFVFDMDETLLALWLESSMFAGWSLWGGYMQNSEQARKDRDKMLNEGLDIAIKLLESHKACSDYLGTLFASAASQLKNARFYYGGHSDDTIAHATPGGPIIWSSVTLYDHFYSSTVGHYTRHFDLTPAMARAFVLLHETSHNTGRILHVPGVKAWSQEQLDKNIYELCGFAAGGSW